MQTDIDLVLFAGQSNMAGRGSRKEAPAVEEGGGYEFRAISDPTVLHPIVEPFGVNENKPGGINEEGMKTGSLVSALVKAYHERTGRIIVGVSASKGGTEISEWQKDGILLPDAIERFRTAEAWLTDNGYSIGNRWMIWCQGETDGDRHTSKADYKARLASLLSEMQAIGIEHTFLIRIGNHRDDHMRYTSIIQAQTEFCETASEITLIATAFDQMASEGLMHDEFHYTQTGYNKCGTQAGINLADWQMK
ncbi:sialate O-acetylesterase [Paenibacillus massiliensis]|uniref:sialate O-acetylesterase n=1 Tax=Paenibacillus massiliensis TaxID=225917 RepID=UPI00046F1EEC|nr:sialate O-acetylesterase [Paenibacillus massiliensis]